MEVFPKVCYTFDYTPLTLMFGGERNPDRTLVRTKSN